MNQELLDRIEKKITVEQCRNMIKVCKEAGLPLTIFFLFGIGETDEDVDNHIKFVRETNPPRLAAGLVNVYKGTRLYDKSYSYDLEEANERYRKFYGNYLSLKEHELMELRWLYETKEITAEEYQKKNVGLLQTITDIHEHLRKRGGEISIDFLKIHIYIDRMKSQKMARKREKQCWKAFRKTEKKKGKQYWN